jgi:hypothetical protein
MVQHARHHAGKARQGRITGSDRSKHQNRKRLLPSNPDIAALIPLFDTGNRRLMYMTNEVLLVFLNTPLAPVFRQLRRELVPSSGVFLFESIAWRGPTPPLRMRSKLGSDDEDFRFETGELSEASAKVLLKKFEKLSHEFDELADLDISMPESKKKAFALMIGFRPWNYWSILEGAANDMGLNAERSQVDQGDGRYSQ